MIQMNLFGKPAVISVEDDAVPPPPPPKKPRSSTGRGRGLGRAKPEPDFAAGPPAVPPAGPSAEPAPAVPTEPLEEMPAVEPLLEEHAVLASSPGAGAVVLAETVGETTNQNPAMQLVDLEFFCTKCGYTVDQMNWVSVLFGSRRLLFSATSATRRRPFCTACSVRGRRRSSRTSPWM